MKSSQTTSKTTTDVKEDGGTPATPNKKQITKINLAFQKKSSPEPARMKMERKSSLKVKGIFVPTNQRQIDSQNIIIKRPDLQCGN